MKLYLVRHGDAVGEMVDRQRPLSQEGEKDVQTVAEYLKGRGIKLNLFWHSSKKRAQQTAQIVRHVINPQGQLSVKEYLLPDDFPQTLLKELEKMKEDVMVVGHLPFIPRLIAQLIQDSSQAHTGFPTGAVAILEKQSSDKWRLLEILTPAALAKQKSI